MKPGPREFFESAHENFLSAKKVAPPSREDYVLAGLNVGIEIAGENLSIFLRRAIAHLRSSAKAERDLTICAWDSSGERMISPPWSEDDYGPRGEIRSYNTERFRTAFDHGTSSLSMIDFEQRLALFWTSQADELPSYESAAPFRTILAWALERSGRILVHGGAVTHKNKGALLAGAGGSGKSSAALLCLKAGLDYLGDDYCSLEVGDDPQLHSIYSSAKLAAGWLRRVPELEMLQAKGSDVHRDKLLLFLNENYQEQLVRSARCRVLLLPRLTNAEETTTEGATPAEALRALAPSSIFQAAGAGAETFRSLAAVVESVPARWLNLGRDTGRIAHEIGRCLGTLQ